MQLKRAECPIKIAEIVDKTIRAVYPHYYPSGAVQFFLDLHNEQRIREALAREDIGGRMIEVFQTPGHSPGHMCFWESGRVIFLQGISSAPFPGYPAGGHYPDEGRFPGIVRIDRVTKQQNNVQNKRR